MVGLLSRSSLGLVTSVWVTRVCPCLFLDRALKAWLSSVFRFYWAVRLWVCLILRLLHVLC